MEPRHRHALPALRAALPDVRHGHDDSQARCHARGRAGAAVRRSLQPRPPPHHAREPPAHLVRALVRPPRRRLHHVCGLDLHHRQRAGGGHRGHGRALAHPLLPPRPHPPRMGQLGRRPHHQHRRGPRWSLGHGHRRLLRRPDLQLARGHGPLLPLQGGQGEDAVSTSTYNTCGQG